jgi:hypothetical protein
MDSSDGGGGEGGGGAGASDPCAGISCSNPKVAECVGDSTVRSYLSPGTCNAGACTYAPHDVDCGAQEICRSSRCLSSVARLTALSLEPVGFAFAAEQLAYVVRLPPGTQTVSLTAAVERPERTTLRVNGNVVTSGAKSSIAVLTSPTVIEVVVEAESGAKRTYLISVTEPGPPVEQKRLTTPNWRSYSGTYGTSIALSADGNTFALGAFFDSASEAGRVYVFKREAGVWGAPTVVVGSNTESPDQFGYAVSLSADGKTLAVGALYEASASSLVNGNQADNNALSAGAAYVFAESGGTWTQQAYLKAVQPEWGDLFGSTLALSGDGNLLAVGAPHDSGRAGNPTNKTQTGSGAVFVYKRAQGGWSFESYVKASNATAADTFGTAVSLSQDGKTLAAGAPMQSSLATTMYDPNAIFSGAVYVFTRTGSTWAEQAILKQSNEGQYDSFGSAVSLSSDGDTLAAGAPFEDSHARGINGDGNDNTESNSGAVYIFGRQSGVWAQQAYVKSLNSTTNDQFGSALALSARGNALLVSSPQESGAGAGVNGDAFDRTSLKCHSGLSPNSSCDKSGAGYLFIRANGQWQHNAYVKPIAPETRALFGHAVAFSEDATTFSLAAFVFSSYIFSR